MGDCMSICYDRIYGILTTLLYQEFFEIVGPILPPLRGRHEI